MADFTLGDLWGVQKICPDQYGRQGVSVLLVNTPKAQALFLQLPLLTKSVDIGQVAIYNPYLLTSVKPHPKRAEFFAHYRQENFNKLVRKCLNQKPIWLALPLALFKKLMKKCDIKKGLHKG